MNTRLEITQETLSKFPTNNSKLITAKRLRDFQDIVNNSKFNLLDDDLNDINFDNTGTGLIATNAFDALIEVNNKASAVIADGTVLVGNIGGGTSGSVTVTGDITSATKTNFTGGANASEIVVNFNDLGTTNYIVILNRVSLGNREDNDSLRSWIIYNESSTSFTISQEEHSGVQDMIFKIAIIQL